MRTDFQNFFTDKFRRKVSMQSGYDRDVHVR